MPTRRCLLKFGALLSAAAVTPVAKARSGDFFQFDSVLPDGFDAARRALIAVPGSETGAAAELPLLVLLHGHKPSASETQGVRAWRDDAGVIDAHERLQRPPFAPLYPQLGLWPEQDLGRINHELARLPFRGLILACPFTPSPYNAPADLGRRYADWLSQTVLPTALRLGAPTSVQRVGLAGVSMGGYLGLEVLIATPRAFSAFSGLQAAISPAAAVTYAERLESAFARSGSNCFLQIHTSVNDRYRAANERLHAELFRRGFRTELRVSPGPHNVTWLREVGAPETLLFHDRALREAVVAAKP
jgi:hypothetical protein